jgi:hypothetical protein
MRVDTILVPRSWRRTTDTERFRDAIHRIRERSAGDPRAICLPFTMPVHGHGSPPAGMFVIHGNDRKPLS